MSCQSSKTKISRQSHIVACRAGLLAALVDQEMPDFRGPLARCPMRLRIYAPAERPGQPRGQMLFRRSEFRCRRELHCVQSRHSTPFSPAAQFPNARADRPAAFDVSAAADFNMQIPLIGANRSCDRTAKLRIADAKFLVSDLANGNCDVETFVQNCDAAFNRRMDLCRHSIVARDVRCRIRPNRHSLSPANGTKCQTRISMRLRRR